MSWAATGPTCPSMPEAILDTGIVIRYLRGDRRIGLWTKSEAVGSAGCGARPELRRVLAFQV